MDERTKQFVFSFHAATYRNGFVLGSVVTPGNVHVRHMIQPLVEKIIDNVNKPLAVAAAVAIRLLQFVIFF